ncbi:MAG: zinc ribbon domain-containing protein [Vicinamibacterales bacterium]
MPIFEYRCDDCRKKTTAIVLVRSREDAVRCQHCGSARLNRLWSRFATPKSEEARLDALADPTSWGDVDESDPGSVMRAMQRMGREMGEDVEGLEEAMGEDAGQTLPPVTGED